MAASLADLLAQKAALEQKIAQAQQAERAQAIAQVKSLMAQYGLTVADLGVAAGARRAGSPATPASRPAPESTPARASRKGKPLGKVPPKYRDPASGATWTGRGLRPRWLQAALAAGRALDEFRI